MGLHTLYGINPGIDIGRFKSLSELVMQSSQRSIYSYKPVVGSVFLGKIGLDKGVVRHS